MTATMRAFFVAFVVSVFAAGCTRVAAAPTAPTKTTPATAQELPFLLGGIQVNEDDHVKWVETLKQKGFNTVEVTVYAKQGDWDSSNLWSDDAPSVIDETRKAKAAGLHVVLILRVALDSAFPRNAFLWHGMIMPRTDDDVREWFRRYDAFVVRWCDVAAAEGIDVVAIGSEMNEMTSTAPVTTLPSIYGWWLDTKKHAALQQKALALGSTTPKETMQNDEAAHRAWALVVSHGGDLDAINARRRLLDDGWRTVINDARAHFKGPLTYAANFDQYADVRFWPQLDVMGINAYFKLRGEVDAPDDDAAMTRLLEQGWRSVWADIAAFEARAGITDKPVIFTELGYTRRRGSTLEPWSSNGESVVGSDDKAALVVWNAQHEDLRERALAVTALQQVLATSPSPQLRGALYWKLSTVPSHKDIEPFVLMLDEAGKSDPLLPALIKLSTSGRPTTTQQQRQQEQR